jgi:hypothetical protein
MGGRGGPAPLDYHGIERRNAAEAAISNPRQADEVIKYLRRSTDIRNAESLNENEQKVGRSLTALGLLGKGL